MAKKLKVKRLPKAKKKLGKQEQARKEFWDNLPENEVNPNAEQDFDKVLGAMLNTKEPVKSPRTKPGKKIDVKKN